MGLLQQATAAIAAIATTVDCKSFDKTLRGAALPVAPQHYVGPLRDGTCSGTNYDYFLLVTQWDITECTCCFSCSSTNLFFTMHGLWPNQDSGDYPCFCTDAPFDPTAIAPIQTAMNTDWPSLNGNSQSFWSHEWSKHGTCASDVFSTQLEYFSGALQARQKYDIVAALAKASIQPSNSVGFTMQQFKDALTTAYGAAGMVQCDSNGNIESVTQCISKNMTAMVCPSNVQDNCGSSTLYLPSSTASSNDDHGPQL